VPLNTGDQVRLADIADYGCGGFTGLIWHSRSRVSRG
jgi:hypothetical protein